MVNNYDVAVLSEKVAYLEAAIKNAGIELPTVTSDDNGKTLQVVNGAWATGAKIPGVVNALDSTSETDALSAAKGKALQDNKIEIEVLTNQTLTTNASGSVVIPNNKCIVDFLVSGTSSYTYRLGNSGTTRFIHIMDEAGQPITSTELTVSYAYIKD